MIHVNGVIPQFVVEIHNCLWETVNERLISRCQQDVVINDRLQSSFKQLCISLPLDIDMAGKKSVTSLFSLCKMMGYSRQGKDVCILTLTSGIFEDVCFKYHVNVPSFPDLFCENWPQVFIKRLSA